MSSVARTASDVTDFWIHQVGPKGWYEPSEVLDGTIRAQFKPLWSEALAGGLRDWMDTAQGALAYLILVDQFPRNMFRGSGRSFATDGLARRFAKNAIGRGLDRDIPAPQRQFFYMPLMHSESLPDQEQGVRMFLLHMPESTGNLLHARAHREVIRRFGRFPHRNDDLGRSTTEAEDAFLATGGYGGVVRLLQAS